MDDTRTHFLQQAVATFRKQKSLGERAMAQLEDAELFTSLDPESNSVAVIVKHLHGNMRSRWTDFLTTDGEKPDRRRDDEFVAPDERSRTQVTAWWENGWQCLFDALGALSATDVDATVTIRRESISVMSAIMRQIDHYAQHVGQIVLVAKHLRGDSWTSLSIPRGKSEEFLRMSTAVPGNRSPQGL